MEDQIYVLPETSFSIVEVLKCLIEKRVNVTKKSDNDVRINLKKYDLLAK